MPSPSGTQKQDVLASLEAKVRSYCLFAGECGSSAVVTDGLPEYALQLKQEGELVTLRALANEIDTWLRECHSAEEQLEARSHMVRLGVIAAHLPALPGKKRVRAIVARGAIRNATEAALVLLALTEDHVRSEFLDIQPELGQLYARWSVKS